MKKSKIVLEGKWTQSIAVGDKSFLELIKELFGIRAKGRRIYESEDEYQLRERRALCSGRHDPIPIRRLSFFSVLFLSFAMLF